MSSVWGHGTGEGPQCGPVQMPAVQPWAWRGERKGTVQPSDTALRRLSLIFLQVQKDI